MPPGEQRRSTTDAASWALRAAAILGVMYEFGFLLMPDALLQLSGDPGVPTPDGSAGPEDSYLYFAGSMARIGGMGQRAAAIHSGSRSGLHSVRARAPLWRHKRRIWWRPGSFGCL